MLAKAVAFPRHGVETFAGRRNAMLDAVEDIELADAESFSRFLAQSAFGAGHAYARPVYGTLTSLGNLGLENVIAAQGEVLTPQGATLLVVGDVDPTRVMGEVQTAFGGWRGGPAPKVQIAAPAVFKGKGEVGFIKRQPAITLHVCASRTLSDVQGSDAGLDVLAAILGQGPTSRLGQALRENNGLTYVVSASVVRLRFARALLICSPLRADQADRGVRLFRETLEAARLSPPSMDELRLAKAMQLASIENSLEGLGRIVGSWEEAIALGFGAPRPEQDRAELEKVTAEEVHRLARKVLAPEGIRWIFSGEQAFAAKAAEANGMGRLRALTLAK